MILGEMGTKAVNFQIPFFHGMPVVPIDEACKDFLSRVY